MICVCDIKEYNVCDIREYNVIISNKSNDIKMMCKLSFKDRDL